MLERVLKSIQKKGRDYLMITEAEKVNANDKTHIVNISDKTLLINPQKGKKPPVVLYNAGVKGSTTLAVGLSKEELEYFLDHKFIKLITKKEATSIEQKNGSEKTRVKPSTTFDKDQVKYRPNPDRQGNYALSIHEITDPDQYMKDGKVYIGNDDDDFDSGFRR
jgi:hypothetical protein